MLSKEKIIDECLEILNRIEVKREFKTWLSCTETFNFARINI